MQKSISLADSPDSARFKMNTMFAELWITSRAAGSVQWVPLVRLDQGLEEINANFYTLFGRLGLGGRGIIYPSDTVAVGIQKIHNNFTVLYNASGTLYFSDTFDRDADTFIPPWGGLIQQAPGRITTTTEQVRKGTHSVKLTALRTDNPNGWKSRADLVAPDSGASALREGDDRWVGWSILFPSSFLSNLTSAGWLMVAEHGYASYIQPRVAYYFRGGPSGGSFDLSIRPGTSNTPIDIFKTPPTFGRWMDFVAHYKFSANRSIGFVELWYNGVRQTFSNGSQRYYTNTLDPGAPRPGKIQHNNYRAYGSMAYSITIYQDAILMGNSYNAVAP